MIGNYRNIWLRT